MIIIAALAGAIAGTSIKSAQGDVQSAYTRLATCVEVDGPAPINERCEGFAGWDIYVGASEHSARLAYSDRALAEQYAQPPVSGGQFQNFSRVIEWRVRHAAGASAPFATIHRWTASSQVYDTDLGAFTGEMERHAQVLVITALRSDGPIGACHIAYVDTTTVPDANTVARLVADAAADGFRCGEDEPVRIGAGEAARIMDRAGLAH